MEKNGRGKAKKSADRRERDDSDNGAAVQEIRMKKLATIEGYLDHHPVRMRYPDMAVETMERPTTMAGMVWFAAKIVLFSDYDGFFAEGTRQIFFMSLFKWLFAKKIILVCRPRLKAPPSGLLSYLKEWLKTRVFKMGVDHFIVISTSEIEAYHTHWGISKEKMTYVPFKVNSADSLAELETGDEEFIYSGGTSLRDYKTLFEAIKGLDIQVKVVTNRDFDKESIPRNAHIIHNSGTISEFYAPCARARFSVFPIESGYIRSAGQGSYLGAMFLGKAVIVSDTPGVRDIIDDGVNGLVVPPDNAPLLREKIIALWEDNDLRNRLGETAKRQVREYYTHERYIDNIYRVLRWALGV